MKKLATLLVVFALLVTSGVALAAGTVVLTTTDNVMGQDVVIYTYTMTADSADGSFPATASRPIDGWIIRVETNPGATAPTALWGLTLLDQDGLDVMGGVIAAGATTGRSATATQHVMAPQPYVRGAVTITPTGNSVNSAVVVLRITVLR